jgi:capsular polysaccharide biosynthesis protein
VPITTGSTGAVRSSRRARVNADTTAEPEGLTRRVVLNFMEAFFRRPWLHLLPLILMLALGGATAFNKKESFQSTGTITAESSTLIGDLTQQNNQGFNFDTPATVVARNINELLRTNEFLNTVAGKLQTNATDSQKALLRTVIAKDVSAIADGDQLVRVSATSERADLSFRLADATILSYVETVKANNIRQSDQTVQFFTGQVAEADTARKTAQAALDQFFVDNNLSDTVQIPLALQLQANRLQAEVDRAEAQYDSKLDSLDQAKLASATAATEVDQRLRVTDQPEQPEAPEPRLKSALLTLVIFGVLGVLLSVASVIVAATLDRTIRVPGDVTAKFDLDVLAVVPDARAR